MLLSSVYAAILNFNLYMLLCGNIALKIHVIRP
jgi:hypothetical protein